MTIYYAGVDSPIGALLLTSDGESLTAVHFACEPQPQWVRNDQARPLPEAARQLAEYFAGQRREFDLPMNPDGTTFQRRVWSELVKIDYGVTISYGELAARIGNPNASRAVGLANSKNPIAIIVPCHRVIGANGTLTGYAGGLDIKRKLLEIEREALGERQLAMACG
jgi:methylated-DNA-[protein]-cysteine S-methyltransferase